jgi:4-amino-4-deoxy-L-arabinose transferase-like glycosyltransferase
MWTMAHGGLHDWLWPHIVGLPMAAEGPLAFWLGAVCIQLFGWAVGEPMAARIAPILFFMLGAYAIWHTTFLLASRKEAQPQKLTFGGQPEPADFGRTLADGALLIYLGCLGLLLRSHETSAEALHVSLLALSMYAYTRYIEIQSLRRACLIGLALGCMALTRGWVVSLGIWLCMFPALTILGIATWRSCRHLVAALTLALIVLMLWLTTAWWIRPYNSTPFDAWMLWNNSQFAIPTFTSIRYFFRYGIWFFWPAWPFAAWAVYAWRRQHTAIHIVLPAAFITVLSLLALANPSLEEGALLPLLPPLVVLAAFGLPTMKRNAINAVDWFSVMTLTLFAAFIWLGWIAKQTGWPSQLAKNAFKLAPGFKPEFSFFTMAIALASTAAWILLVNWRISRQPSVLWRAVVLSSGGIVLCWLLINTLWLPWINYGKTYADVAHKISEKLPPQSCVESNVSPAQRASFAYMGGIQFPQFNGKQCAYLLILDVKDKRRTTIPREYSERQWELVWEGNRPSDKDEHFMLLHEVAAAADFSH